MEEYKFPYTKDIEITIPEYLKEVGIPTKQTEIVRIIQKTILDIGVFKELKVGAGDKVFKVAKQGLWLGDEQFSSAPLRITPAGALTSTSATITGTITATDGKISNWFINTNTIADSETEANANVLIDSANTLIRLGPTAGDYITLDGANQRIRSSNYSAGNAGFTIEPGLLEAENIHARGKLSSVILEYNVQSCVGGELIVSSGDKLATDMTAAD